MIRSSTVVLGIAVFIALGGCVGLDFSPDGKSVAVTTTAGIAIMPVVGGPRSLIPDSKEGFMPLWSPDGKWLLFWRTYGDSEGVYLYDATTRRSRRIGAGWTWPYAWREDSKRFVAVHEHESGGREIVWYDLAEDGVAQAVPVSTEVGPIVWLPETDNIAFLGGASDNSDVYTVESGEVKRISRTSDLIGLALSSSRKELVWARRGANLKYQALSIYRFNLVKRSVERLPFPMRIPLINPDSRRAPDSIGMAAFSPDGQRLALTALFSDKTKPSARQYSACFSVDIRGSDARLVRKSPLREGSTDILYPVWSRDGARLGVYDSQNKKLTVAVFDPRGLNGKQILAESAK